MNRLDIFKELAAAFEKKIASSYAIALQFEIVDDTSDNFFQVQVQQGRVNVYTHPAIDVEESWVMRSQTLEDLYHGKLSPLTAYANEPDEFGDMRALIELKQRTEERKSYIKPRADQKQPNAPHQPPDQSFISRNFRFADFFNRDSLCKVVVDQAHCKTLHGVKAIALHNGFEQGTDYLKSGHLHACFFLEKDQVLKQPPIEKSVYVLNGSGEVLMDGAVHSITQHNYYRLLPVTGQKIEVRNHCSEILQILYL